MSWIVASRGSFISEQSIEGRKMLSVEILNKLDVDNTYLFEILYESNKIVVNYGDREELVLLGVANTKTGEELPYETMVSLYSNIFTIVRRYDIKNITNLNELKALEEDNKEGFVIRFNDGFRVKIKFEEYVRLHRILTNVSNLTIWRYMKENQSFDELLDRVPDEFYDWIKMTVAKIQNEYNNIERLSLLEFLRIYHVNQITDRRLFAEESKSSEYQSILFKLYDRRDYGKIIWKMIRPVYSKPFKVGYEQN